MNMQCLDCHQPFPILTEEGRLFKLTGYTLSTNETNLPPLAVMFQPSFTRTKVAQAGGAAPGFGDNNNFALTQASVFYSGRLFGPYASKLFGEDAAAFANKFGIFSQVTYDGIAKAWSWDNTELRYANIGVLAEQALNYGIYLNNNPTLQDLWNTTPAWRFPFSSSKLAPTPASSALIEGALAQQVAGFGAYVMIDHVLYLDIGGYRTLGAAFQKSVGIDPSGETQISGIAPYWRVAYTHPVGTANWEIGTFGLATNTFPGRDPSAGTDRIVDVGFDMQWQDAVGLGKYTAMVSEICESDKWDASLALGNATNATDRSNHFKATLDYLYNQTYGFDTQYFSVTGSSDALFYSSSRLGSPNSDGFIVQANYLPFNKGGGPSFWPRSNLKLSLQYTYYAHFDGSRTNVDGSGRNAADNNTLYLEAWIVF